MPGLNINSLNINEEGASVAGEGNVGVQTMILYSNDNEPVIDSGFAVNSLSSEEEASSITGHANSSGLVPERIDLSGIDLGGTGGLIPQVVIDNIYNGNKIQQWEYAYNKTIKTVELTNEGRIYTITITFLDNSFIQDSIEINYQEPISVNTVGTPGNVTFVNNVLSIPRDTYTHDQQTSASIWTINHNMGKFPSVTIIDSAGDEVEGEVKHNSQNTITINFSSAFSGKAYLN